jgi:trimethylamine:corrinoid methyltransferase-like protein
MTPAQDETEAFRRRRMAQINGAVESHDLTAERKRLEAQCGQIWDAAHLADEFEVLGFMAPYAVVRRTIDGRKGSLEFQHHPRFYFNFVLD